MPKLNYGALPHPLSWVIQFLLVITIEDAYFYYVHRISHELKWFYKKVHYLHHEWFAPTAMSISWMHPVEWVMARI